MIAIRTGDSLKLRAWPDGQAISGTFSATLDGQTIATNQESGQPIVHQFSNPGTYIINVTHFPLPVGTEPSGEIPEGSKGQGEGAQHATCTVHVVSADFGEPEPLLLHYRKSFAFPGIPAGLAVEADAALAWHKTTAPGQLPRVFATATTRTGLHHMIARIPGSGAIAARGTISGYDVGFADRTDDTAIYDFLPDGTGIYRFTIVATGLPAGFRIHLRTHHQGATFPNGSRDLILTAADFDANGIAMIEVLYPPGTDPRVCHTAQVVEESGGTYSASILFNPHIS